MKIAYITAGAAGMYCGSCMKDNTLAAALNKLGHDCLLMPTYTPIRTDEDDVSQHRVFFGGINVYLQQKSWLFRHTPWLWDRLLDFPRLLRWVSRFAVSTRAEQLGSLTVSMLQGRDGKQRKEVAKLVQFLATDYRPDVVVLSNLLLSGLVPELKNAWARPVLGVLQGDDIYLESLPPADRAACIELIRKNGDSFDGFMATSGYYADFMAGYLGLPRERMRVVYPGINLAGHGPPPDRPAAEPFTIGYFARICPEKGFHQAVDAYVAYRALPDAPPSRFRVAGWLGDHHRAYFESNLQKLRDAGLASEVEHVDCPTHADKVRFLRSLDVLSVPTTYREPKGLYVLEALANGVPVVQPAHGSFPELVEATGGGLLVEPGDAAALARAWRRLADDRPEARQLGALGRNAVLSRFTAEGMARATLDVLAAYHDSKAHPETVAP
ncbi:MAG TPA: glycosyltransferase family 4 protein [Gemmataceae bacterium]|nr:glycosyltransferase family 4 protein [Gemmataceae bacterium]